MDTATRDCIEQDILKDFLERNRAEVKSMWLYEYDEEKHLKTVREEGREEGRAEIRRNIITNIMKRDPLISKEEAEKQADVWIS